MKRAIALSGGGTKGSYELGVWRALNELGIEYQIVTGTSIGAINGALMVTRDYERAYELWSTITMEDMLEDGINLTATIEGLIDQRDAIRPFLKKYIKNKGADISPYAKFIERMIDEEAVRDSDIDYGLVTVQFPSLKPCELTKKDIPRGKLKDYILASSAIFPFFPMHKIDDMMYLDGYYYDNLPIALALKMGAEEVIAIDLQTTPKHRVYAKRPYVTYIKPCRKLGTMMNFDHMLIMENIGMGYRDAMKALGACYGYRYTFRAQELWKCQSAGKHFRHCMALLDLCLTEELPMKMFGTKGDFNRIHSLLAARTGKQEMDDLEYFTAAGELCAEIFKLDYRQIYRMEDFAKELTEKVTDIHLTSFADKVIGNDMALLVKNLSEMKRKKKTQGITAAIYYASLTGKLTEKPGMALLNFFPKEMAAAFFLLSVRSGML